MMVLKMQLMRGAFLFLILCCSFVSTLYFHIDETEKKCFIEEIPDETMTIVNYRTQLYGKQSESYLPATPGLGMFVEVKDPDEKVILSRQYGSEGRFTFTSHTPGEHQICLQISSSNFSLFAGGMLRVHLDIQAGEHTNNYTEIAAKDKLTELQLRVRQLVEQVDQIRKAQNYQRYLEERFRQTSESTNQRVVWWFIVQMLILVATGFWQMRLHNHYIIFMKMYQLMVEHTPEEDSKNLTKIEPSVSLLKSPKDNVDDPTGNFRSTPLTGWTVFLLLLCALLGIVVCAVVGAVVFQKWQERNRRFY